MNDKLGLKFVTVLSLLIFSGCGGGGGTPIVATTSVTLTADKTQAIASTNDNVTLTATVRDGNGSPLPGHPINFNVPASTYPVLGPYSYTSPDHTDLNGNAVIHLSYPPVGPNNSAVLTVTAASGGVTSNAVTITFANPQQFPASVTLTVDKTSLIANGIDLVNLTATATDAGGSPLVGQAIGFNMSTGLPAEDLYAVIQHSYTDNAGQVRGIICTKTGGIPAPWLTELPITMSMTASINGVNSNTINITISPP